MTKDTLSRAAVSVGLFVSLFSSAAAFVVGEDVSSVLVNRFLVTFIAGAGVTWLALTVINSVIISAAQKSVAELRANIPEAGSDNSGTAGMPSGAEALSKGLNLDLTSSPEAIDISPELNEAAAPEVVEFEPFKPKRMEAD